MQVIGIAGYRSSGRTHIANRICAWANEHGYDARALTFDGLVQGKRSKTSLHKQAHDELTNMLIALACEEKEHYANLCKWNLESSFKEIVIIIDGINYLDDIKFLNVFNAEIIFVDSSNRLEVPPMNVVRENLANKVSSGAYPLGIFTRIVNNNRTKKALDKALSTLIPDLLT